MIVLELIGFICIYSSEADEGELFKWVLVDGVHVPVDEVLQHDLGVLEVGGLVVVGLPVHAVERLGEVLGPPDEPLEV